MSVWTMIGISGLIVLAIMAVTETLRNGRLERENARLRREVYKLKVLEDGDEERENEK